ncbi:MAG: tyrosine-type recombinase/integrase, partial [Candidatus Aenigmarchaeota archaeon]|nr:tyrosine-type recombinase/integrase [Candidatus Aenigmarchaeota archaeon]
SFATHLIQDGYSVSEVQTLLGHKSPETTFIYLHTASPTMIKIKSPLDNL